MEKELPTSGVVSIYSKILAILLVLGLNVYFVCAAILYGHDKSYKWQAIWLSTFIFNFGFEVFFNGTIEVITVTPLPLLVVVVLVVVVVVVVLVLALLIVLVL